VNKLKEYREIKRPYYKVSWVGIVEGYEITKTDDIPNEYDIFKLYSDAKSFAIQQSSDDVQGAKRGLEATRSIRKSDIL